MSPFPEKTQVTHHIQHLQHVQWWSTCSLHMCRPVPLSHAPLHIILPYDTPECCKLFLMIRDRGDGEGGTHNVLMFFSCTHSQERKHGTPMDFLLLLKPGSARARLQPMELLFRRIIIMRQRCNAFNNSFSLHLHLRARLLTVGWPPAAPHPAGRGGGGWGGVDYSDRSCVHPSCKVWCNQIQIRSSSAD